MQRHETASRMISKPRNPWLFESEDDGRISTTKIIHRIIRRFVRNPANWADLRAIMAPSRADITSGDN